MPDSIHNTQASIKPFMDSPVGMPANIGTSATVYASAPTARLEIIAALFLLGAQAISEYERLE